jgi:hypothetical protein
MDDEEIINEAVAETIPPEQAAWAAYVSTLYLHRDAIGPAHRAFLAGWRAGWSEGLNDGVTAERMP